MYSKLCHPVQPRSHRRQARAFTLIEILIVVVILGILASIVIPQFSSATLVTRENTLKDDLRYLRTQVVVYKAQHLDIPPGYPAGNPTSSPTQADFVAQMTTITDSGGNGGSLPANAQKYGPYLSQMPSNPINGLNTVNILADGASVPTAPTNTYGWIYQPRTQIFLSDATGTGSDGIRYFDY